MRGPTLEGSTAQIQLLVDRLTVDAASLRARYGEDFASTPSEDDIAGTTANMLGEALLDAATHPQIRIAAVLSSGPAGFVIDADIDIKSRVWHGSIPLELEIVDDVLVAHGSTVITHEALGLEPFSVILGALRVANEIEIRFSLTARR